MKGTSLLRVGFWSAVLTAVFYIAWELGLAASIFLERPWDLVAEMTPSLFIPLAWVVLMVSINRWVPEERRIFSEIAVVFGAMYATLNTMVYFVQLTVAIPKELAGEQAQLGILFIEPKSFTLAVDILGYTLMSLSALFAAFVFRAPGLERWIRRALLVSGVVAVVLPLQMFYATWPSLFSYVAAPREITPPRRCDLPRRHVSESGSRGLQHR